MGQDFLVGTFIGDKKD